MFGVHKAHVGCRNRHGPRTEGDHYTRTNCISGSVSIVVASVAVTIGRLNSVLLIVLLVVLSEVVLLAVVLSEAVESEVVVVSAASIEDSDANGIIHLVDRHGEPISLNGDITKSRKAKDVHVDSSVSFTKGTVEEPFTEVEVE